MRRLIEFAVPGGGTLLAEVDEPEGVGPRPAGVGNVIERATMGLDEAIAKVRPLAELLLTEIAALTQRPNDVEIEFGVKLNVAAGIVISSTALEGNCKIKLSWKHGGALGEGEEAKN
jgi:hypothetical protein